MLLTRIEAILTGSLGIGGMELISTTTISNIQSVDAVIKTVCDLIIFGVVCYRLLKAKGGKREKQLLEEIEKLRRK
jgi:3-phosphoglycerate kinase